MMYVPDAPETIRWVLFAVCSGYGSKPNPGTYEASAKVILSPVYPWKTTSMLPTYSTLNLRLSPTVITLPPGVVVRHVAQHTTISGPDIPSKTLLLNYKSAVQVSARNSFGTRGYYRGTFGSNITGLPTTLRNLSSQSPGEPMLRRRTVLMPWLLQVLLRQLLLQKMLWRLVLVKNIAAVGSLCRDAYCGFHCRPDLCRYYGLYVLRSALPYRSGSWNQWSVHGIQSRPVASWAPLPWTRSLFSSL